MTNGRRQVRVLVVAPKTAGDDAASIASRVSAKGADAVSVESIADATEAGLHARMAVGGVDLLYFVGRGRARRGVKFGSLELDTADGGSRKIEAQLFGKAIAQPTLRLAVLQPADLDSGEFDAQAHALVEAGVAHAVAIPSQCGWLDSGRGIAELFISELARGASLVDARKAAVGPLGEESQISLVTATPEQRLFGPRLFDLDADFRVSLPARSPADSAPPPSSQPSSLSLAKRTIAAKRVAGSFDVFLCHNSADKPAVKTIAAQLKARGILPWLDEWELPPGQPWQPLLEQQIGSIGAAAVFVGRAGIGPWQEEELNGFLREFVARKSPVIPLLLSDAPNSPTLPVFLNSRTYVDFRAGAAEALDRLIWGITGVRPYAD